jgi:hypothetical protein
MEMNEEFESAPPPRWFRPVIMGSIALAVAALVTVAATA